MRAGWAVVLIVGLAGCQPQAASDETADGMSAFRREYRESAIRACAEALVDSGVSQAEIDMACPCMADEVLAATPEDTGLVAVSEEVQHQAVATCTARAEEQFGPPAGG